MDAKAYGEGFGWQEKGTIFGEMTVCGVIVGSFILNQ